MHRYWSVALLLFVCPCAAAEEPFWRQLVPQREAEISPSAGYQLRPEHGPWLVVAATFSGEGASRQARDLAVELRRDFNLKAYTHEVTFDLASEAPTRGFDAYGRPRRTRFRRGDEVTEHAVLVGDFRSVGDDQAQKVLARIKHLHPKSLTGESRDSTSQNLAAWRTLKNAVLRRKDADQKTELGPMSSAFISRNPLLPAEYFVPKGVDQHVEAMNEGLEYSLLDVPGRQTVKVATFRGNSTLISGGEDYSTQASSQENSLHVAAQKAHELTLALRAKKWEAYEFHDYDESIVAIGSFEEAARQLPDGRVAFHPDVEKIIRTFDASFEPVITDPDALATQRKAEEVKQRFNQVFSRQHGRLASGLYPKSLIEIPFDIHPQVIEIPKRSISTAYVQEPR